MNPRLVAIGGPVEGETFSLVGERFTIGRHVDNDLQLVSMEVSRRHVEVRRENADVFMVKDLGSRHGIFVNSRPVIEQRLSHSDLLTIGNSVFLFLLDETSGAHATDSRRGREQPQHSRSSHLRPGHSRPGRSRPGRSTVVREPTDFFYSDATRVAAALPQQLRIARDLNVLLRVSTELQGLRSLEELGERVVRAVAETVDAQRVSMLARDSGIETLTEVATASDSGEWTPQDTVLDQVVTERVGLLWEGGDLSVVCTPVVGHDGVVAVLYGESDTPTSFDNQDLELFGGMTGIASLALEGVEHVRWLERENQRLRAQQLEHDLVGESPGIRRLLDLVGRVARADTTVLIRGESGTGKELVARAIHRSSARGDGPFVAINCATLSETLLESELFGHEKGSFTGAIQRQVGKLEAASGGTLFLDEVGEIPAGLQAKLLRVLQERQFERIGGTRPIHADVRVVAATNRDLENAVQDGSFRDDLYFRLKVIQLDVPALRHRRGDIPLLTRHFLALHGRRLGRRGVTVSPATRRCLVGYGWPGNVRELGNVVERALVLGETDVIHPADLPGEVVDGAEEPVGQLQEAVVEAKKSAVLRAYRDTGGDYSAAADVLGIHVNSLHRMIARLGLKDRLAAAG